MNIPDTICKLLLIPYFISLLFLEQPYLLVASLFSLIIIVNIGLVSRSRYRLAIKPSWILPLSFIILYSIEMLLPNPLGVGVLYLSIALLLTVYFGSELEELSKYSWLYLLSIVVLLIVISLTGLGNYLFYIATPLVDYLWLEGMSSQDMGDRLLVLIPLLLLYYVVASPIIIYVGIINIIRILSSLEGIGQYILFIDFYLRLAAGWFVGLGH